MACDDCDIKYDEGYSSGESDGWGYALADLEDLRYSIGLTLDELRLRLRKLEDPHFLHNQPIDPQASELRNAIESIEQVLKG